MSWSVKGHFRANKLFIAMSLLLSAPYVSAQTASVAEGVEGKQATRQAVDLDGVTVSAQRLEESTPIELAKYGNRLQVIEGEEIARRSFVDLAQTLQQMAPALFLMPKSGAFDYVYPSLEGSRSGEILWLVDGVRINNRLYSTTTPLDTIPASMIERVEILEGGQGLFYGTQAVAGVVNVITKATLSTGTDGQLSIGADSNEGRHLSGNVRTAIGPHQFVAYASSDQADGYQAFHKDDYQPSGTDRERGYDVTTAGLKYAINSERVRVSAGYQKTDATLDYAAPNLERVYYNKRTEDLANVKLDWESSESFGFYVKGYYHSWHSYINRLRNVIGSPGAVVVYRDNVFWGYEDYGLNAMAKLAPGNGFEYYLGYDYQNYSGKDESLLIAEQEEEVHALFGQVRMTPDVVEGLALSAGVRHNAPKHGENATIWNVSGQYDVNENLFFRATGGTAYRLPDAEELFGIDPCCTQGNPGLQAEESRNLNASVGGYFDIGQRSASWELVGFARKVDNLIAGVVDPVTEVETYQNTSDSTKVNGFLATTTLPIAESLTVTASYTKTDAKANGRQIDRIPESSAKLMLDFAPPESNFGGSLIATYAGETTQTTSLGAKTYGQYWLLDLSGYLLFGDDGKHRLSGRVENLTDKLYITNVLRTVPDSGGAPYLARNIGSPRTFYLTYSYAF
ncbi:TonB-dependent receptor plug domain-containing protein [Pseudoxanthomonas indica]|nr:TonB-dependent receptor [Pseudoxanthomonas indica]